MSLRAGLPGPVWKAYDMTKTPQGAVPVAGTREAAEKARAVLAELAGRIDGASTSPGRDLVDEVKDAVASALEDATGLPYSDALKLVGVINWGAWNQGWDGALGRSNRA